MLTVCIAQAGIAILIPSKEVAPGWQRGNKGTISKLSETKQTLLSVLRNAIRTDECRSRTEDPDHRVSVLLGAPYKARRPLAGGWGRRALMTVTGVKRRKMQAVLAEMPAKRASGCCSLLIPRLHIMQGSPLHAPSGQGRGWCYVHPTWAALRPVVGADGKNADSLSHDLLLECWRSPVVGERGSTGLVSTCHGQ